jgi:hypothetical protein
MVVCRFDYANRINKMPDFSSTATGRKRARDVLALLLMISLLALSLSGVHAQTETTTLSNNSGSESTVWFITGEPSLVMNGFDLGPLNLNFPIHVRSVSIAVETPTPGQQVEVVVYQDATGGSPIDATVAGRMSVNIAQSGVFTAVFPEPVEINQPVLWAGFYLPVDFEFLADTSGTSVLTYWAWQPGARFDLANLNSAGVFGPANGSAPVNLDMGGIARINVEIVTDGPVDTSTTTLATGVGAGVSPRIDADGRILQVVGDSSVSLAPMVPYSECTSLSYDALDIAITYRQSVRFYCKPDNINFAPPTPEGYSRRGLLYDVFAFGLQSPGTVEMPYPVTHCISPAAEDLERAVIGLGYGAPRQWTILPTVRFGSVVCAELNYTGHVSYFVPN